MTIRTIIVGGLALACGVSAAVGVHQFRNTAEERVELETVSIVVTALDIPRGTTLSEEAVFMREWPKEQLPDGALTSVEEAVDRTVLIPLLKGEPLVEKKLAQKDEGRGMAPLVKKGMRAFTIQTPSPTSSVAGFVLPGNKVDVLLTLAGAANDGTGGGVTMTLIQNIEILAVDQQIEAPESNKTEQLRSVTLSVTERQAKKLSLAQNRGILNLTLRNDSDVAAEDSPPVTLNDIRYVQGNLSVVPAEEEKSEVTTVPVVPTQQMRLRIRTMRGTASGQVVLEQYPALLVEPKPRRADHYAGG
jgi:pilus assembly protein CpaB